MVASPHTRYTRVVALLPSGWAQHGKWNREHAALTETATVHGEGADYTLHMSTHLLPYSEHSNFAELQEFLQVLSKRECMGARTEGCRRLSLLHTNLAHHLPPFPPPQSKFLRPARITPIVFDSHGHSSKAIGKVLARFTGWLGTALSCACRS